MLLKKEFLTYIIISSFVISNNTWFDMSSYGLMGTFAVFSFDDVKRGKIPRMYPEFLAPWQGVQAVWIGMCRDSFDFLLGFYIDHTHSTS